MKTIKITIQDNMDIALLLSGINFLRNGNLNHAKTYLSLPEKFNKDKILDELVDDYDKLNSLGAQLSNLLKGDGQK